MQLVANAEADGSDLAYWNGYGGFAEKGREYVVRLTGDRTTPQPWINVIANPSFGFHSSAEGASFTWSRNSRDYQLTPWSNDPVANRPGEAIYIHDQASGRCFSPFAAVVRDPSARYEARHGQGYSVFSMTRGKLVAELTQIVDQKDPVKLSRLTIRNGGPVAVRLRVYAYAEWVLGTNRARNAPTILPSLDRATGALLARNPYSLEFPDRVAFLASDGAAESVTADRAEFIGKGSAEWPASVRAGASLSGTVEAGRDPCAAIARDIEVAPGGEASLIFVIGDAGSPEEASALVSRHCARDFAERLAENREAWDGFLGTIEVETPDQGFNMLVNRWLPYQSLACRIRARSAFYQASGAFGFRDQLQDTLAFLVHDPSLARGQILNAASRQFPEGDVQHWWLPRTGAGVRTMISDDVVWLGYAVAHYASVTGDMAILKEEVPFIEGPALRPGEHDAFYTPDVSKTKATVYDHAARALDLAVKRTGASGLPLFLGGDWNDGMNRVGENGKGESVWLGWFLLKTLTDFIPIAKAAGRQAARRRLEEAFEEPEEGAGSGRLGWRVVSARQLRRRHAARLAQLRRVQHRYDRPVVERAVGPGRTGTRADGDALGGKDAGRRPSADHQAVHAAVRQDRQGSGLREELSAGRSRKRRPIYACGDMVRHCAGRARACRRGMALVPHAQSDQSCARRRGGRTLPRRTLCRGGRHLFGRAAGRPRRMDLVHGLGRLALPRGRRGDPRHSQARQRLCGQSDDPRRMERLLGDDQAGRHKLSYRGRA